ncbi:MAG: multiple antibiotic resistance (MarC)-related protein [Acidimicrobiaceae bacterium]|nr:multiple antibiotic resistance (MarC)-related protein [Acidimicrobiaceae bacterium]
MHASALRFSFQVFVTLLVIMDPLGSVPVFLSLTASRALSARRRLAWQAVLVAGSVITVFALFGQQILALLGITVPALQGSGGLLLLLVALELLTDRTDPPVEVDDVNVALVPLGTPLIAGPGAIVATIVFVRQAHGFSDAVAIGVALVAVLIVLYLALRFSLVLLRVLRPGGIHLLTRIFGLLLSAIAVQLIAEGIRGFVRA